MEHVRWGILSTARINDPVLAELVGSRVADVIAVAGRDRLRTEEYARVRGIPRAFGSYDELLADPDVEAVYISLPNGLHLEWALKALVAGKHVLCEKPLTCDVSGLRHAFALAASSDLHLSEAFMWRHQPQTLKLVELCASGVLGRLVSVHAVLAASIMRPGDPRLDPALEGGALMDLGCYCVSAARLVAGEPVSAYASPTWTSTGVDSRMVGILKHPDDVVSTFECAMDSASRDVLEIVGTDAVIRLRDPWHARIPVLEIDRRVHRELLACETAPAYRLEIEDLSRAIRSGGGPLLGEQDAVAQARAMSALQRSAVAGAEVVV